MIHTSAPATLMLMGEHAVLHGKKALVAAATPRLHVYLTPRIDRQITIQSALGEFSTTLDTLQIEAPFKFVLSILAQCQCPQGFDLKIESEFSATLGLGSSAAVLVATALAMSQFQPQEKSIFEICYHSLIEVQGRGSGADLMAAILGGIVCYGNTPLFSEKIWPNPELPSFPITVLYSGYKMPTAEVIQILEIHRGKNPSHFADLFNQIDECVTLGKAAILSGNAPLFAEAMRANQKLMEKMHLSDPTLTAMIKTLEADPHILAAKISGSGLGDCVFGLGKTTAKGFPGQILNVDLSETGMKLHD